MTNKVSNSESNRPTIAFVASKEIQKALEQYAKQEERSISWIIRKAIEQYLKISPENSNQ